MTRAKLDKRPGEVSAMFDKVAGRYDLLNDVLSLGQDRWWRRIVARAVGARPGELVLDLAAGTGTSSRSFTAAGASCVACDFSLGMLQVGARQAPRRGDPGRSRTGRRCAPVVPPGRCGSWPATRSTLPFRDQAFDAVTISFGLRNVADPDARAGRDAPGHPARRAAGHLRVRPPARPRLNTVYGPYLVTALPAVARRLSRQPGRLRLSGRVDQGLARPSPSWPGGWRGRAGRQYAGGT